MSFLSLWILTLKYVLDSNLKRKVKSHKCGVCSNSTLSNIPLPKHSPSSLSPPCSISCPGCPNHELCAQSMLLVSGARSFYTRTFLRTHLTWFKVPLIRIAVPARPGSGSTRRLATATFSPARLRERDEGRRRDVPPCGEGRKRWWSWRRTGGLAPKTWRARSSLSTRTSFIFQFFPQFHFCQLPLRNAGTTLQWREEKHRNSDTPPLSDRRLPTRAV